MKTLVLIDSNAIIHRAYHALPKTMSTRSGEPTNAVYGFATALIKVLEDIKPDYIAASFDLAGPTFRHEQFADYKATRVKADQELYDQIPRVKEMLSIMEIPIYEKQGFEADDTIGTIVRKIQDTRNKIQTYIVSGDKDIFQLIDGNIKVYNLRRGLSDTQIVDREVIEKEYHLQPEDFIDLKALAGDASDNIPGVPGIGPKTATTLLQTFGSLQELYSKIADSLEKVGLISKSEFSASARTERDGLISKKIPNPKIEKLKIQKLTENWKLKIGNYDKKLTEMSSNLKIKSRVLELLIDFKDQAFLSQKLATIHKEVPIEFNLDAAKWGDYDKASLREFFEKLNFRSLLRRFGIIEVDDKRKLKTEQAKRDKQLKLL